MKLSGKRFYISDTHFSHRNIIKFLDENGNRIRPFDSLEEMDNLIIENWNSTISPNDTVVHLGDVVINRKSLSILNNLNGRKILIRGNHDIFKLKDYLPYFDDIRAIEVKPKSKVIFSHVPIHPDSIKEGWVNIHGHTHQRSLNDNRYFNISIEVMDYMPIEWNDLLERVERQRNEKS